MTSRSNLDQWRRETQAAVFGKLANRVFTRKTDGLDGIAKRVIARQAPTVGPDPELDHPDPYNGNVGELS